MGALAGLLAAAVSVVPGGGAFAAADPGMSITPMPVTAVSLAQAGEVVQWKSGFIPGPEPVDVADVPASLAGVAVTQVAYADSVGFAVTAAGRLVSWGGNGDRLQNIPADVAATEVAQVATAPGGYAGAVTRAGEVKVWGVKRNFTTPLNVPAGLTGVKQLALTNNRALALRNDGTVVAWGQAGYLPGDPPPGLKAAAIALGIAGVAYALTVDGRVEGWGDDDGSGALDLPSEVQLAGNVRSVAAVGSGAVALLANGTLVSWGPGSAPPASAMAVEPVATVRGAGAQYAAVVDANGVIHHWGINQEESGLVPPGLNGRAISYLGLAFHGAGAAIVTKMLRGADPLVSGSAVVGQTLTATPGTFSASPETVTGQWLENGAPIAGATGTTLALTAAMLGKAISYRSTATKTGETTVSSTSAAVTVTNPVQPPADKVASKTMVAKVTVAKKARQVTVTGKVTAAKPVSGKATVTIKKGKKVIVTKAVAVSAAGAAKLTVKKFATLVAKKLKAKGKKAKTAYRGKYVVTIAYAGNTQVKASSGSKGFKIKK